MRAMHADREQPPKLYGEVLEMLMQYKGKGESFLSQIVTGDET